MTSFHRSCLSGVALPLLALATPVQAAPAPTSAMTEAALVQLPHISIRAIGRGVPVVLIPGLATPRAVWEGVAADLARTHDVLLVQVNGFGGDAPGANLGPGILHGIVADLHGYLVGHGLQGAAVVGHSMGGLVGLMYAKAYPTELSKLMIVDALPFFAVLMAPPGVDPTPAMVEPQARAMRDKVAGLYGKPLDPEALAAQTRGMARKPAAKALLQSWAGKVDPRVTAEAMYEDLTTDLRADLPAIATPITVVFPWNEDGPTLEMAGPFYRKQFAAAPHVSFVPIGDSAHFVMLDQPAAFRAALDPFLATPSAGAPSR